MLEAVGKDGRRRSAAIAASVGPDGVLLVDTLHHGAAPRLRETLGKLGSSKIRFVVNTHFHLDHVGGLEILRDGAKVVAHVNTERRLSAPQRSFPIRAYPAQPGKLPDHVFAESFSITFNGEEVRAIHVPEAHTDADVVVYFAGSKVLVTGDIYNGPGRLSTPSPLQGGDLARTGQGPAGPRPGGYRTTSGSFPAMAKPVPCRISGSSSPTPNCLPIPSR